ncbi:MAG: pyridoxamine 5'-phosphate oxidase family protein [Cytophagales bacterium]|nr:pyridoxamine 5'-phosphate oxidase family protein [Rhizobacter sp.]
MHATAANDTTDHTRDREKLWGLVKDIKFAMFTTRHGNGHLHSRPMTTQNGSIDEDSSLWFFMSKSSEPVRDIAAQTAVNISYAEPEDDNYVSVSGDATLVEDVAKKKQLWNKMTEAWFPKGVTDPDLALVQVRITHADYWESKDNKLTQIFKMATAAVTGKPPSDMSERGRVNMG